MASVAPTVRNTVSLHYLISAAHKMENHAARTLYMLDQQQTLAQLPSATDGAGRKRFLDAIDALAVRLDTLHRDTQLITDEVDQLSFRSDGADELGRPDLGKAFRRIIS